MPPVPERARSEGLGVLLLSQDGRRVHFAFSLAAGAAALGRPVVMFASAEGCRALLLDAPDVPASAGVAGLEELRRAALDLDVRLILCEASLRLEGASPLAARPGVEIAGIATFLDATRGYQLVSI